MVVRLRFWPLRKIISNRFYNLEPAKRLVVRFGPWRSLWVVGEYLNCGLRSGVGDYPNHYKFGMSLLIYISFTLHLSYWIFVLAI
jgi:hypothetical protein